MSGGSGSGLGSGIRSGPGGLDLEVGTPGPGEGVLGSSMRRRCPPEIDGKRGG